MLTSGQHHQLLDLLSSSDNNTILSSPTRRAVFTQISDCHLEQCLRTIASAVAYAQITSRVAILFIHQLPNQPHLTQVLQLGPHGILNNHAILISLTSKISDFHNPTDPSVSDWADFSVVQALPPNSIPFKASTSNNPSVHDDLLSEDHTDGLPTIGNTKKVATLDNLAALDTHVSLSLSEVVWSRYAPRTAQEALLEHTFQASQTDYQVAISRASILGRHRDTRLIYTTDKKLHQVYHIPNMLLKGMSPLARKILFLKLQSKKRRGILHPKVLFVHTQYGLGNRLRALGSAMAFARRTDRVLVLIWEPDQHLNCKYTDLFVMNDEFVVSDAFSPGEEWPFRNNSAMDKMMMHVKWYNFMRVKGVKVISSNAAVEDDKKFHLYISTCYVIQSSVTPFIIRSTSSFWHVLRSLTPHIDVVRLVERFASYPVSNMIGIHIRGKMIKTDISGVNATNYTEESSRTTDYWRNLTRVDTFIEEMKRQTADQLFYVASDQKEVLQHLEREFPSRIFYTPRHCDSRNKDCLPFALADILLLSKCASLRGSYWSSFSELSTRIGGARFLLAGIDFGRP